MCQLCMQEPVGPSQKEYDEAVDTLKADNEQLNAENERLSEVADTAMYWQRRAIRAEEILDEYAKQAGRKGGRASKSRWLGRAR